MRARERARAYVNRLQRRTHSLAVVLSNSRDGEGYTIIRFLKRTLLAHSTLDERLLHCMLQAQGQLSHSHPIQGEPSWAWTQAGWPLNPPLLTSIVSVSLSLFVRLSKLAPTRPFRGERARATCVRSHARHSYPAHCYIHSLRKRLLARGSRPSLCALYYLFNLEHRAGMN